MTISGAFSESFTLVVTFAASPTPANTPATPTAPAGPITPADAQTPSTSQLPSAGASNVADTTQISPLADALSKLGPDSAARADEILKKLDTDGDGSVSKQEFADNAGKLRTDLQALRHAHGHHGHHGKSVDKLFSRIDANGDGTLSKDELTAAVKNAAARTGPAHGLGDVFKKIDTNGDGSISQDELGAALRLTEAATPTPLAASADSAAVAPGTVDVAQTTDATTAVAIFAFSFTAIVQYQLASQEPASTPVGTKVNAAG